jgi:C1A family cysteine protease
MKNFLFVLMLFILSSCSSIEPQPNPISAPPSEVKKVTFLAKEEVFALYKAVKTKKSQIKSTQMDEKATLRLSRLIPLVDFFPKSSMKQLTKAWKKSINKNDPFDYAQQEKVDLRDRDTPIKDQDDGKCTAFSGTAAIESTIGDKNILSAWDVWSKYAVYSCDSFMNTLTLSVNKVCDERYYPQYGKRSSDCGKTAHAYISDSLYLGNDANEIVRSLNNKHVVYFGISTPNDVLNCKTIVDPKNGFANGGHAMLIVGYYTDKSMPDDVMAIVRNSWGTDCADHGYFYMPLSIIKKAGANFAAWEIKAVSSSVNPNPSVPPKCVAWKRVWYAPWRTACTKWE